MKLENESKEFLDYVVEHCEANKIEEINEDELQDLKEKFINEAIKIEDIEALLGDGKPNGKYTKFTLKDGTYVLYHPTIGLEYRAKDGSLLPHNWKTVKAMKKELVMAGMINESDNKKMIESLLFKIKAKYGYDNLKVDYENGVVTGADEDIKFDVSGDNDYVELIETLQRMLKFGDEEVNEAVVRDRDYKYKNGKVYITKKMFSQVHKDYKGSDKKSMLVLIDGGTSLVPVEFVTDDVVKEMLNEAKNKLDNGVYLGREVKLKDGIYTIISCSDKSGKNQDCLLMKNNQPSKEVEEFITKEMLLPLNEANLLPNPPKGEDKKTIDDLVKKIISKYKYKNFHVDYKEGQIYGGSGGLGFNNKGYDYTEVIEKLERILKYGDEMLEESISQESNITTALKEIANGNTGAGIEAFKSAFLDRLSMNQDFQRITSELK